METRATRRSKRTLMGDIDERMRGQAQAVVGVSAGVARRGLPEESSDRGDQRHLLAPRLQDDASQLHVAVSGFRTGTRGRPERRPRSDDGRVEAGTASVAQTYDGPSMSGCAARNASSTSTPMPGASRGRTWPSASTS
jgi:hypothetical protein